jgi:hypothetical protein
MPPRKSADSLKKPGPGTSPGAQGSGCSAGNGASFDLGSLYQIDMRYFEVALDLLKDWRFDHHIAARSKLLEQLLTEIAPDLRVDASADTTSAQGTGQHKKIAISRPGSH